MAILPASSPGRDSPAQSGERLEARNGDDIAIGIDLGTLHLRGGRAGRRSPSSSPTSGARHPRLGGVVPGGRHGAGGQRGQEEHHHQRREHRVLGEAAHRPLLLLRRGEEGPGGDAVPDRRGREQLGAHPGAGADLLAARRSPRWCSRR